MGNTTAWTATDARRTNFVVRVGTESFLKKYPTRTPFTDRAPVIRYAEVLLNLAEAITRSTNAIDARALALLNAVRGRSNAAGVYTAASFATSAALIDAILTERRIELLGEGFRSNDLVRLALPLPAKSNISVIPATANNYIWPIPQSELNVNKEAVPNP
ncbi:MAG: RagB/SusD family nutrient uptake outer membrane protein [Cytophagaceae bacterium]|nr:RagB/SusD family nutrient uptake outer membrane protein [Cytophagaceae bacterium]